MEISPPEPFGPPGCASVIVPLGINPLVDLWDGWLDDAKTRPWQEDSTGPVWSLGKGMLSIALLRLVDKGLVDLDAPVATYWTEFAQAGKGSIRVHMILSHHPGLPSIEKPLPKGPTLDWDSWFTRGSCRSRGGRQGRCSGTT